MVRGIQKKKLYNIKTQKKFYSFTIIFIYLLYFYFNFYFIFIIIFIYLFYFYFIFIIIFIYLFYFYFIFIIIFIYFYFLFFLFIYLFLLFLFLFPFFFSPLKRGSKVVNLYLFEDIKVAKPLEVVEEMEKQ